MAVESTESKASTLIAKGFARDAYDLLSESVRESSSIAELRALALLNMGALSSAQDVLGDLVASGRATPQTYNLLGRLAKEQTKTCGLEKLTSVWQSALSCYRRSFELEKDAYPAINAAYVLLMLGCLEDARQYAAEALKLVGNKPTDYWQFATRAEARLVLGDTNYALMDYRRAVELAYGDDSALVSMRKQALSIADRLHVERRVLDELLIAPSVTLFSGHRATRDLEQQEQVVFDRMSKLLASGGKTMLYTSAADGADVIMLEAAVANGIPTHLVLPVPVDVFRDYCLSAQSWRQRFDGLVDACATMTIVSATADPEDPVTYQHANRVCLGLATLHARELHSSLNAIAAWDGKPGGVGGTADCVELWRKHGIEPEIIELPEVNREQSVALGNPRRTVKAMLSADVMGFSQLSENELPLFFENVLPAVKKLCDQIPPDTHEMIGDGFSFVFSRVGDAVRFARGFVKVFQQTTNDAGAALNVRSALHAGPLMSFHDPLRQRTGFTGQEATKTARIEPVADPNQILVSQQFAALWSIEEPEAYDLNYAGKRQLPKNFGIERVYSLP